MPDAGTYFSAPIHDNKSGVYSLAAQGSSHTCQAQRVPIYPTISWVLHPVEHYRFVDLLQMSVKVVNYRDVVAIADNAEHAAPQATKNFFDVFGTTGCMLNCQQDRNLGQKFQYHNTRLLSHKAKQAAYAARIKDEKESRGSRQEWFTASEITVSAGQGCGSCSVIREIIRSSFSQSEHNVFDEYQYSVSLRFELRRRPRGEVKPVEIVHLFQPYGSKVQFQRFFHSNFLGGKDVSIARLRRWMDECLSNHNHCSRNSSAQDNNNRPTRLLDVYHIQRGAESGIRLIETSHENSYRYVCLSHRWDDAVEHHETTLRNLSDSLDFLNLKEMPTNFQDAVSIARDLDIRYLWIDSICIIQDGDNDEDLERELAKMGSIYQNACLTIAAVSSPNSSEGCFIQDKWPDFCYSVSDSANEAHLIGARALDKKGRPLSKEDVNIRYPLLGRAWVFQERLLSSRLLQCNYGEFTFECLESSHCECNSTLAPHFSATGALRDPKFTQQRHFLLLDQLARNQTARDGWKAEAQEYWKTLVQVYMELDLSDPSDVFPAIAGCGRALASHLNFAYVAGMWKETLPTDLLWFVVRRPHYAKRKPRSKDSTAPSWSWASVSMKQSIQCPNWRKDDRWLTNNMLLRNAIKEVYHEPKSTTNPFGKLKDAYLKLDAVLYPWYIRSYCDIAMWESGRKKMKGNRDLHIEQLDKSRCITHTQGLVIDGATLTFLLDTWFVDNDSQTEPFSTCVHNKSRRCELSQIYLLHALHRENPPRSFDVFLLLKRIDPAPEKPNCYKRIGLMFVGNDQAVRTWDEIIRSRVEPQREEFWLL